MFSLFLREVCLCTSSQGLAPRNEEVQFFCLWKDIMALTLKEYQEEEGRKEMDLETRTLILIFMVSLHELCTRK